MSEASYPRKYYFAEYEQIITPGTIPIEAGRVIAANNTDGFYYDIPDPADSSKVIRRKASSIEYVDALEGSDEHKKYARREPETIFIVHTGDEIRDGQEIPLYSGYYWNSDKFDQIFNNSSDFQVSTITVGSESENIYLVGSKYNTDDTGILYKRGDVFISNDGKIHADITGNAATAGTATNAINATKADRATHDGNGEPITSYIKEVSSDYSGGTYCLLTFKLGDNNTLPIKVSNTTYSNFTPDAPGLVPSTSTVQPSDTTDLLLTGDGWVDKDNISFPEADQAEKDGEGQIIAATYIKNLSYNNGTKNLTVTKGNNAESVVSIDPYSTYTETVDGLVPAPTSAGSGKFLRNDGWALLPTFAGSTPGMVPTASAGDANKALRGDGTWQNVSDVQNTAGANPDTSKLYLVGTKSITSGSAGAQSYSWGTTIGQDIYSTVYVNNNGKLYQTVDVTDPNGPIPAEVVDVSSDQAITNKTYEGYTLGDACERESTDTICPEYTDTFVGDGSRKVYNLSHNADNLESFISAKINGTDSGNYDFITCEEYSDETSYTQGDYCIHENASPDEDTNGIYQCANAVSAGDPWDFNNWTRVVDDVASPYIIVFHFTPAADADIQITYTSLVSDALPTGDAVYDFVNARLVDSILSTVIAPTYSQHAIYNIGDFVMYKDVGDDRFTLYRCEIANNQGEFDPHDWVATDVISAIKYLIQHPSPN